MMELIKLTRTGSIVTVALDRPEQHNAFSPQMIDELRRACEHIAGDAAVRVVVLTGTASRFAPAPTWNGCARRCICPSRNLRDAEQLAAMYEALDTLPKPVIGRVNGAAIGGGAGLVACCDIWSWRPSGVDVRFAEVKLGLIPAVIARYVVPKIGAGHARALFVFRPAAFDTGLAQRIGLVHDVVPAAKLDAVVQQAVDDVLSSGPEARSYEPSS